MINIEELNLDELLELLDEAGDDILPANPVHKSIKKFVKEYGITSGQIKVPNYVIFQHYNRLWRRQGNKISKIAFFRDFNKIFDQYRTKKVRYYMLNEGVFSLTEKDLKDAKHSDKIYENKRKKENKKKPDKISESQEGDDVKE